MEESNLILIVGLGATGLSIAKYFIKQGIAFSVVDSRESPPNLGVLNALAPNVTCYLGGFDESIILSANTLYLSPGIDSRLAVFQKALDKGIKISSDIELFVNHVSTGASHLSAKHFYSGVLRGKSGGSTLSRRSANSIRAGDKSQEGDEHKVRNSCLKPILAITGSNGKSTVTTLLAQCINESGFNALAIGNIGAPVLDHVDGEADYYVIELSSFQLALLDQIACHTAVVLNISPDHLDRHDGFADYCKSKMKIYENALNRVVNIDDEHVVKAQEFSGNVITVSSKSSDAKYYCDDDGNLRVGDEVLLQGNELMLIGRHNYFNVLVVLAFCDLLALPRDKALMAIKDFRGLDFRCECIAKHNGITWVNDSKATNIAASMTAIDSVLEMDTKQLVLIMGGQAKGQDFSNFAQLKSKVITDVILIGEAAEQLSKAFAQVARVQLCDNLQEAVIFAQAAIRKEGVILFSPACASFDMFDNYLHRGMVFNKLIKEITTQ